MEGICVYFLALTGEGNVHCGQNIDCVVLNPDEIKGLSQLFNLLCFLVVFIWMFKKWKGRGSYAIGEHNI